MTLYKEKENVGCWVSTIMWKNNQVASKAFYVIVLSLCFLFLQVSLQYLVRKRRFTLDEDTFINFDDVLHISVSLIVSIRHQINQDQFFTLLSSLRRKESQRNIEIIIADYDCSLFDPSDSIEQYSPLNVRRVKYVPQCNSNNASNQAIVMNQVDPSSEWILFLESTVIQVGTNFVDFMVMLGESRENAVAAGCKIVSEDGTQLLEAGRIVWSDGAISRYGENQFLTGSDAPEFVFSRPVDAVSDACFLVQKDIYLHYHQLNPDVGDQHHINLQLYIQHILRKQVWFQPRAQAFQTSYYLQHEGKELDQMKEQLKEKWTHFLNTKHHQNPHFMAQDSIELAYLRASDLNTRNPTVANILYFDELLPNKSQGAGYGRAFDNVSMLASLGYKVTILPFKDDTPFGIEPDTWCNRTCRNEINDLGIEILPDSWEDFMKQRSGLYDVVIISRPNVFEETYERWRYFYQLSPFVLIYDCEALGYRRDEMLLLLSEKIPFPGAADRDMTELKNIIAHRKQIEHALITMADFVVSVSEDEKDIISKDNSNIKLETIGHAMEVKNHPTTTTTGTNSKSYHEREGILFIGAFHGGMYYNGDAIWFFLKYVYPLVLQQAAEPISLKIAGRHIPSELRDFVTSQNLDPLVTFLESAHDLKILYDNSRIFIAPHQYGAGVQYKLSEALSYGIPTVMSKFSADSLRISKESQMTCVGEDPNSFKSCVISIYENEEKWNAVQKAGYEFIEETHSPDILKSKWKALIQSSMEMIPEHRRKQHDNYG